MLTLDKIYHASFVLKEVLRRTDLIAALQIAPDSSIFLKPENLQLTGSFKVRGAYYKISQLSDEEKSKGRDCLLGRQPCTRRRFGCDKKRYQIIDMLTFGCTHIQGRSNKEIWGGSLSRRRCLRRRISKSLAIKRRKRGIRSFTRSMTKMSLPDKGR